MNSLSQDQQNLARSAELPISTVDFPAITNGYSFKPLSYGVGIFFSVIANMNDGRMTLRGKPYIVLWFYFFLLTLLGMINVWKDLKMYCCGKMSWQSKKSTSYREKQKKCLKMYMKIFYPLGMWSYSGFRYRGSLSLEKEDLHNTN